MARVGRPAAEAPCGARLVELLEASAKRDQELESRHDLARASFTEDRRLKALSGTDPLLGIHFCVKTVVEEVTKTTKDKKRIVRVPFCMCYCGSKVQKHNWNAHMNMNGRCVESAGGMESLPDRSSPLFKIIRAAKTRHFSEKMRGARDFENFLVHTDVNTVLGRILFAVAFHQFRFSAEIAFPLRVSCLRSGDRCTKLCRTALRGQCSTEGVVRLNAMLRLTMGEGMREILRNEELKSVDLSTPDLEIACLCKILARKDTVAKAIMPHRERTSATGCVTPSGVRDICRDYLKTTAPDVIEAAKSLSAASVFGSPAPLFDAVKGKHGFAGFRSKEHMIDVVDEELDRCTQSLPDEARNAFNEHVQWNASGPGPIRMLFWILGVPFSTMPGVRLTLTTGQETMARELLNILAMLSPLMNQMALGQLFVLCDGSKVVNAIYKGKFMRWEPWTPPTSPPAPSRLDLACQLTEEHIKEICAAVFAENVQPNVDDGSMPVGSDANSSDSSSGSSSSDSDGGR